MDKEKLLPSLRFSGYKGVWEQRKLGEIADKVKEKNAGLQYIETFTNSAEFGIISQKDFFDHSISKIDSLDGYYIVRSEDFVYNPRISVTAPVGPINRNKLKRSGVMSPLYTVFRPQEVDNNYLEFFFKSRCWYYYMKFNGDSGARADRFSIKDELFFQMPIPIPHIDEQKKIGKYLSNLDNLITLHQKEYDKLLIMKKAMLEKVFPKNGNKVPEVRFSEFDGAWEYRKLGTISDKITEKNGYMEFTEILTNSAEYGIISQRDFFDHDIAKQDKINGYYVVRPEDFVYNPRISTTAPVGPIGRNKLGRCGVISPLYTVFRPKEVDNSFLEQFFKSSHWYSFMRFNGDTGARSDRFSIKDATFFEMPIPFPKLDEQRRIGQYLDGLDVLISLQDKKLTKLKNIKAGCLEKMFV